jgi:hypothetical protein
LAIALANKIARIAWGVLHGGRNFEIRPMNQAAASLRSASSRRAPIRCPSSVTTSS